MGTLSIKEYESLHVVTYPCYYDTPKVTEILHYSQRARSYDREHCERDVEDGNEQIEHVRTNLKLLPVNARSLQARSYRYMQEEPLVGMHYLRTVTEYEPYSESHRHRAQCGIRMQEARIDDRCLVGDEQRHITTCKSQI